MNLNIVVAGTIYVYAPYAIYITWLYIMPAEICQLCGMACCAEREREVLVQANCANKWHR